MEATRRSSRGRELKRVAFDDDETLSPRAVPARSKPRLAAAARAHSARSAHVAVMSGATGGAASPPLSGMTTAKAAPNPPLAGMAAGKAGTGAEDPVNSAAGAAAGGGISGGLGGAAVRSGRRQKTRGRFVAAAITGGLPEGEIPNSRLPDNGVVNNGVASAAHAPMSSHAAPLEACEGPQQPDDSRGEHSRIVEAPLQPVFAGTLILDGRGIGGKKRRGAEAWEARVQEGDEEVVVAGALEELEMRSERDGGGRRMALPALLCSHGLLHFEACQHSLHRFSCSHTPCSHSGSAAREAHETVAKTDGVSYFPSRFLLSPLPHHQKNPLTPPHC
ncbi:unnamed protein product [Closterium sp. Yama58-4]|nr:unnamed protein product [Closterium sp. Yama58-4]